jgi:hypothetical protein
MDRFTTANIRSGMLLYICTLSPIPVFFWLDDIRVAKRRCDKGTPFSPTTHTHTLTSLALVCIDLLSRRRPLHVSLTLKVTVVVWAGRVLSRDNPTCRCLDPAVLTFALLSFRVRHDHGWRADG